VLAGESGLLWVVAGYVCGTAGNRSNRLIRDRTGAHTGAQMESWLRVAAVKPGPTMCAGGAKLLEVVTIAREDGSELAIHAMSTRAKYRPLLPGG
jgi:hypothetical protein